MKNATYLQENSKVEKTAYPTRGYEIYLQVNSSF